MAILTNRVVPRGSRASTFLSLLFAAILCLVVTEPAYAPPANKEKGPNCSDLIDNDQDGFTDAEDPDCGGDGDGGSGEDGSRFHVAVLTVGGANPWSTAEDPENCAAYTGIDAKSYTFQFPRHLQCVPQCWIRLDDYWLTDDIRVSVRSRKGRIIGMSITGQDTIGSEGIAHDSDEAPLDFLIPDDTSEGFTVPINQDVTIYRLRGHLGGPREEIAGVIRVGELIYSPCTPGACPSSEDPNYPDDCL